MSTPYLPEKVAACLNLAAWYVRLKKLQQAEKLFTKVIALVEQEGSLTNTDLKNVLEKYATLFRRLNRMGEAETLSQLAQRICDALPGLFNPDGSEIPWWKRPGFLCGVPALPVEFKASRAEPSSMKPFSLGCLGTLFVGALLIVTIFRPVIDWLGEGVVGFTYLALCPLGGALATLWYAQWPRRKRDESWCRLTEEGIEYHEPNKYYKFLWAEIDHVWTDSVCHGDENTLDAVIVTAGKRKFQMSARFFTEQEVKWVDGICKLKSGVE